MPTMQLEPQRIFLWQLLAIACLALGHVCATILLPHTALFQHAEIRALLDLDAETGFGTWYSALAILACAATAYMLSRLETAKPDRRFWFGVALLAAFLALDEAVGIHEHLSALGKLLTSGVGIFRVSWWLVYLVLLAPVAIAMAPGVLRLDSRTRNRLIVAGIIYVAAAVGLEIIESAQFDAFLVQHGLSNVAWERAAPIVHGDASFTRGYSWLVLFEETLEMLGVALALRALLMRAEMTGADIRLTFGKTPTRPDDRPDAPAR